jgi:hypothetical protein
MTDNPEAAEAKRLKAEIAERSDRLSKIEGRPSRAELVEMARTNPARFNQLFADGAIPNDAFKLSPEDNT